MLAPANGRVASIKDELVTDQKAIADERLIVTKDISDFYFTTTGCTQAKSFSWSKTLVEILLQVEWLVWQEVRIRPGNPISLPIMFLITNWPSKVSAYLCYYAPLLLSKFLPIRHRHAWTELLQACASLSHDYERPTTVRAVDAAQLAAMGCIVQRTDASDALASIDILCGGKTRPIKQNWLTAHEPYCLLGDTEEK